MLDLEQPLREELRARADAFAVPPTLAGDIERRARMRQRGRHIAVAAAFAASLVAGALSFVSVGDSEPPAGQVQVHPTTRGAWQPLPVPPLAGRDGQYSVWTGHEMIVWGGSDYVDDPRGPTGTGQFRDGAAYNPRTQTWHEIAEPPLNVYRNESGPSGLDASAVWTGREMLVFGVETQGNRGNAAMAYNPERDRWRVLAAPPDDVFVFGAEAVWTGKRVLLYSGGVLDMTSQGVATSSPGGAAAYDPRADRWSTIAPFPLGPRSGESVTWTGKEMVVWSGTDPARGNPSNDGAAYNPKTDSWRELPPSPIGGREVQRVVWTGKELVMWGGNVLTVTTDDGAAYNPHTNSWRELAPSPLAASIPNAVLLTGERVLVVGGRVRTVVGGNSQPDAIADDAALYDPTRDTWTKVPSSPLQVCGGSSAVWTGRVALLWGGRACGGPSTAATNQGAACRPGR